MPGLRVPPWPLIEWHRTQRGLNKSNPRKASVPGPAPLGRTSGQRSKIDVCGGLAADQKTDPGVRGGDRRDGHTGAPKIHASIADSIVDSRRPHWAAGRRSARDSSTALEAPPFEKATAPEITPCSPGGALCRPGHNGLVGRAPMAEVIASTPNCGNTGLSPIQGMSPIEYAFGMPLTLAGESAEKGSEAHGRN